MLVHLSQGCPNNIWYTKSPFPDAGSLARTQACNLTGTRVGFRVHARVGSPADAGVGEPACVQAGFRASIPARAQAVNWIVCLAGTQESSVTGYWACGLAGSEAVRLTDTHARDFADCWAWGMVGLRACILADISSRLSDRHSNSRSTRLSTRLTSKLSNWQSNRLPFRRFSKWFRSPLNTESSWI